MQLAFRQSHPRCIHAREGETYLFNQSRTRSRRVRLVVSAAGVLELGRAARTYPAAVSMRSRRRLHVRARDGGDGGGRPAAVPGPAGNGMMNYPGLAGHLAGWRRLEDAEPDVSIPINLCQIDRSRTMTTPGPEEARG